MIRNQEVEHEIENYSEEPGEKMYPDSQYNDGSFPIKQVKRQYFDTTFLNNLS